MEAAPSLPAPARLQMGASRPRALSAVSIASLITADRVSANWGRPLRSGTRAADGRQEHAALGLGKPSLSFPRSFLSGCGRGDMMI